MESLHEYYRVSSLENYDEVYRAVAFFIHKYGEISWLESNNEYWLERDAALRTAFHITTGFQTQDMDRIKQKSAMKRYYQAAGIPTARYHLVEDLTGAKAFAHQVGYPVIVKPDNGVGANHTYRLNNDQELGEFMATKGKASSTKTGRLVTARAVTTSILLINSLVKFSMRLLITSNLSTPNFAFNSVKNLVFLLL